MNRCRHFFDIWSVLALFLISSALHADEVQDQLARGSQLLLHNEPDRAADVFRKLLDEHPQCAQAGLVTCRLGEALQKGGKTNAACEVLAQALQRYSDPGQVAPIQFMLAELLVAQDPVRAAAHYAAVAGMSGQPLAEPAAFGYAEALYQAGNWKAAAGAYAQVIARDPTGVHAAQALYSRGWSLMQAGNTLDAAQLFKTFAEKYPTHELTPESRFRAGYCLYQCKHYTEAASILETFAETHATNSFAASAFHTAAWSHWHLKHFSQAGALFETVTVYYASSPLAANAAWMSGRLDEDQGNVSAAARSYTQAVALGRDNDAAQHAAVELIRLDRNARRYESAATRANAFLAAHPTGPMTAQAQLYGADALLALGHADQALVAYQAAGSATNPVMAASATNGTAWALRKLGRHAEAADAFSSLAAGTSSYADDAGFWAARSQEDAGRLDLACAGYGAYLTHMPAGQHADEAAYHQAYCAWQNKHLDQAYTLYTTAITTRAASPFAASAMCDLAWVCLEQGNKDEAYRRFQRFVAEYPTHALACDVHFRLGELAYDKELFGAAITNYEAAISKNATFKDKALYKLGWAHEKLQQPELACRTFQRLAHEMPDSEFASEAQCHAAALLQSMGKPREAYAEWAGITSGPFAEKAAFQAAECQRAAGDPIHALIAYEHLLTRWPQSEFLNHARLGRGDALRALGRLDEAIAAYDEIPQDTKTIESAHALMGYGHCWLAKHAWEKAAEAFLKIDVLYDIEKLKPEALSMLVKTWEQAGNEEKAALYRAELKKRYPSAQDATLP